MANAALLVECGDGLGAHGLAAARAHLAQRQAGPLCAQHRLHHRAALIDLRHDGVGAEAVEGGGDLSRPARGREPAGEIVEHMAAPVFA